METTCILPSVLPSLSLRERSELMEYIRGLVREGRHLEASNLYSKYFPWA
jgi:hypothetical protein